MINIDLHDFDDDDIKNYAKDHLGMMEDVSIKDFDDRELLKELDLRGGYNIENAKYSLIEADLIERFNFLLGTETCEQLNRRLK